MKEFIVKILTAICFSFFAFQAWGFPEYTVPEFDYVIVDGIVYLSNGGIAGVLEEAGTDIAFRDYITYDGQQVKVTHFAEDSTLKGNPKLNWASNSVKKMRLSRFLRPYSEITYWKGEVLYPEGKEPKFRHLEEFSVDPENSEYVAYDGILYSLYHPSDTDNLILDITPHGKVFPDKIFRLNQKTSKTSSYSLYHNEQVETLIIPEEVEYMYNYSFSYNRSLKHVIFEGAGFVDYLLRPNQDKLSNYPFKENPNLRYIEYEKPVKSIIPMHDSESPRLVKIGLKPELR